MPKKPSLIEFIDDIIDKPVPDYQKKLIESIDKIDPERFTLFRRRQIVHLPWNSEDIWIKQSPL